MHALLQLVNVFPSNSRYMMQILLIRDNKVCVMFPVGYIQSHSLSQMQSLPHFCLPMHVYPSLLSRDTVSGDLFITCCYLDLHDLNGEESRFTTVIRTKNVY